MAESDSLPMPAPMLGYHGSEEIQPGKVVISHGRDCVELKIGPLDGRGWIAALLPTAGYISLISLLLAVELRRPVESLGDMAMSLLALVGSIIVVFRKVSVMGRTHIVRFDAQQMATRAAGDDEEVDVAIGRIMSIRARRIWWLPLTWALTADGFPTWWNPNNDPSARDLWPGDLILLGSRRNVEKALAAVQPFVREQSPPPVKAWVPWIVVAGILSFGSFAFWSMHETLAGHGGLIACPWLSPACIAATFAVPITAVVLIGKGKLRRKTEIVAKVTRPGVMIEGLPPRTMH
jgi:hypothetical protein